jgi:ABC-2 type transport system ATP-binding protein
MIDVRHFRHRYPATLFTQPTEGARDISIHVEPGEIHGFLGPNGAGKSTTIKALLGLLRVRHGDLRLFGEPVAGGRWRARVGYMPEHPNFYDYLTGLELVSWFARLSGLGKGAAEDEARRLLERVGLGHAMRRRIRGYSKGMLQRAGLAQALVGSPELLILDEPMTGLDPIGRKEMRELILSLKQEGKTVFYSTHILPDIEMTCDRVTIIHEGATLRTATVSDLLAESVRRVTLELDQVPTDLRATLESRYGGVFEDGRAAFDVPSEDEATALLGELPVRGARLRRFEPHRATLEEVFMRVLGDEGKPS